MRATEALAERAAEPTLGPPSDELALVMQALAERAAEPTLGLPSGEVALAMHEGWPREPRASRRAHAGAAERRGGAGLGGAGRSHRRGGG